MPSSSSSSPSSSVLVGISGRRAKDSAGYFAAHGQVGWFVNGIAFAGDYLSAASFLGICGMIAFYGYDGFLYSIGFLAGWVVALFVIAEPIKKLGKFTFADALAAKFEQSRGITFAAAISTLVVSTFYLIPQMVGAGSLVKPLLGFPHWAGVVIVGGIVILIVTTAGMVSTTWVQFIKGSLLVVFCFGLVIAILNRGVPKDQSKFADPAALKAFTDKIAAGKSGPPILAASQSSIAPTGSTGPAGFVAEYSSATFTIVSKPAAPAAAATMPTVSATPTSTNIEGSQLLLPGGYFEGIRSPKLLDRLDFASLMLALFCGTAALPHF